MAYFSSILIHAFALWVLALFVLRALDQGGAPESLVENTPLLVRTETAPPEVPPPPSPPPPAPQRPVVALTAPPKPIVRREIARIVPQATPQPPTPPPPAFVPPVPPSPVPSVAPTVRPTVVPTVRPTLTPTLPPTPEPTVRPTAQPTLRPTPEPTLRPTPEPTVRPTPEPAVEPTVRPTTAPTERPTAAPTALPTAAATAVAERAAAPSTAPPASAPPPRVPVAGTPLPAPVHLPVALVTPSPAPAPTASGLLSLNDRLRAALPTKPTAGMQHVDLGAGYTANRVLDAYEASLAPPLEVLAKTFGLIYTTRTLTHADSVAYVYERLHIALLGHDICRAYQITEHPLRAPERPADPSKPGALTLPGPLHDEKPQIDTIEVDCNAPGTIKVAPGSITTPVPRRRG